MKKLTILLLITILLLSAAPTIKLMRLQVFNKSDMPAYIKLYEITTNQPNSYYLTIAPGDSLPGVRMYTLVRGIYDMELTACGQEQPTLFYNYDLTKAVKRLVILPCAISEAKGGDNVIKYNPTIYPYEDYFGTPLYYDLGGSFKWRY